MSIRTGASTYTHPNARDHIVFEARIAHGQNDYKQAEAILRQFDTVGWDHSRGYNPITGEPVPNSSLRHAVFSKAFANTDRLEKDLRAVAEKFLGEAGQGALKRKDFGAKTYLTIALQIKDRELSVVPPAPDARDISKSVRQPDNTTDKLQL